ncbi:MAG TPA: DMP19 family protein [Terriglobales bacterium]|nr:DMP19 family protein [Terriglobales bacterium]
MDRTDVITLIDDLEAEVNNGGFHQFFYNSAGDNTAETIQAIETIRATSMADIVRRAAAKFPGGTPPRERFARQDILLELFPHANAFAELDAEFYGYPDDLANLLKEYSAS